MSLRTFATEAVSAFHTTAAIVPSSRYLAEAMLEPLPLHGARTVVEFGPGTGVMTRALLDLLPPEASVLAFEINPQFADHLRIAISDPRLAIINASAETAGRELRQRGYERVDAALSSLGLGFMSDQQRHAILGGLVPLLDQRSVFTQYQYIHGLQLNSGRPSRFDAGLLLRQYFESVRRRMIWRNLPPAYVLICQR